jgi:hypothetical protein
MIMTRTNTNTGDAVESASWPVAAKSLTPFATSAVPKPSREGDPDPYGIRTFDSQLLRCPGLSHNTGRYLFHRPDDLSISRETT